MGRSLRPGQKPPAIGRRAEPLARNWSSTAGVSCSGSTEMLTSRTFVPASRCLQDPSSRSRCGGTTAGQRVKMNAATQTRSREIGLGDGSARPLDQLKVAQRKRPGPQVLAARAGGPRCGEPPRRREHDRRDQDRPENDLNTESI